MSNPFFSIIIPTYNRSELLKRCLDSVVAQTYYSWEAIVVDNYSEDNTEEVVKSYNDERIRYIRNHNYGVISISRNKALDLAQGDWICFLDSDDSWFPNKLECITRYTDQFDLIYHEYQTNLKKEKPFQRTKSKFYTIEQSNLPYVLKRGDPINPSCAAVSKQTIGDIRFSEDRKLIAVEDYDFFLQLIAKNIKIYHLKKVLTYYDVNTGCSHGKEALDRDRLIYHKYSKNLTKNDLREVLKYYYLRKAAFHYKPGSYLKSLSYFRIAASSSSFEVRKRGITGMIKSVLLFFLDRRR